jgi:iron complex transport system permease protein
MAITIENAAVLQGRGQYRALAARRILILSSLLVALVLSVSIDMALGPARYTLGDEGTPMVIVDGTVG